MPKTPKAQAEAKPEVAQFVRRGRPRREGPAPVRFDLRLDPTLAKRVEAAATKARKSMTEFIVSAVDGALPRA